MKTKHIAVTLKLPAIINRVIAVEYEQQDDEAMDKLFLMCAIHEAIKDAEEDVIDSITSEATLIDSDIAEELGEYEWGLHTNLEAAIEAVKEDIRRKDVS